MRIPAFTGALLLVVTISAQAADHGVRLVKTSIPMPDGVQLAATLYMPADLQPGQRVPVLLEYLPYRKDDDDAVSDYGHHAYFARHGYVGARVDIRGFGNSGGVQPPREYSAQEQEDGERVIAWLARQRWSNGKVGMLGISWGGFNAIQMAMRRPPALKAILAVAATEALFTEDVHYMDGIMHVDEFEVSMDLDQGRSGAPAFPLDEDTLAKRMDSTPWSLDYFRHQRNGAFWRAPVRRLARHSNTVLPDRRTAGRLPKQHRAHARAGAGARPCLGRSLESRLPEREHLWPAGRVARPSGALVRSLAERASIMASSTIRGWCSISSMDILRAPSRKMCPGEWRAESWPPAGLKSVSWFLAPNHQLTQAAAAAATDHLRYVPSAGVEAGFWWGELLGDQRPVDAL